MPCQPVWRLSPPLPFEQPFPLSRLLELIAKLEPFTPNSQLLASLSLLSRGDNDIFGADRDQLGLLSIPVLRSQLGGIILVTTSVPCCRSLPFHFFELNLWQRHLGAPVQF